MTPEELDVIEKRANGATPGPWEVDAKDLMYDFPSYGIKEVAPVMMSWDSDPAFVYCVDMSKEDAEFIAHAREDIPRLVEEVRQLWELVADLQRDDEQNLEELAELNQLRELIGDDEPWYDPEWREKIKIAKQERINARKNKGEKQ